MIPFEVPDRFLGDVASGALRRIGATLREQATGRIVGHVQETFLLQGLIGAGNPVGLLLSAGQLGSSLAANAQLLGISGRLNRVMAMLSTLQMLNVASAAASVVGVGVSAAGAALVLQRLAHLDRTVAGVHRDVIAARLTTERMDVRLATAEQTRVDALLQREEAAFGRSDAVSVWKQLEGPLAQAECYWRGLVGGRVAPSLFLDPRFTLEESVAAYATALTLGATRVRTLLLIEEHAAALDYAKEVCRWHDRTLTAIAPIDLASARSRALADAEGILEEDARSKLVRLASRFFEGVREIQLHMGDRPAVIQTLIAKGVRGREYVESLRGRTDVPVLVLPAP